jgi:8-oxo-dGTP pyrophosphatase MutT (NUDIX family)
VEDSDKDVIDAALRETEEEVGIPRHQIEVIGELEPYRTGTGYHISPIVGFIDSNYELTIDEFEVAEVFEVPLSFIFDPANHQRRSTIYRDVERHFYVLPYEDRYIWGATAGMLVGFYSRVMT